MSDLVSQFHSVLGILIFFSGLAQIILPKGGRRHVIIGQVYLYAWIPLLITGAYLGGPLISIVGLFGFYFALKGADWTLKKPSAKAGRQVDYRRWPASSPCPTLLCWRLELQGPVPFRHHLCGIWITVFDDHGGRSLQIHFKPPAQGQSVRCPRLVF